MSGVCVEEYLRLPETREAGPLASTLRITVKDVQSQREDIGYRGASIGDEGCSKLPPTQNMPVTKAEYAKSAVPGTTVHLVSHRLFADSPTGQK